jgi:hypothetical protein
MAQVVMYLSNELKALTSNPSQVKKNYLVIYVILVVINLTKSEEQRVRRV